MNVKYTLLKPLSGKLDDYIMIKGIFSWDISRVWRYEK